MTVAAAIMGCGVNGRHSFLMLPEAGASRLLLVVAHLVGALGRVRVFCASFRRHGRRSCQFMGQILDVGIWPQPFIL
ncbi:MAG: hypothetical protein AB7F74_25355 [Parvibaculaceae bacterium]